MIDPNFDVDLQALANKYQVHIVGTATPVDPANEAFDITVQAVLPAPVETDPAAPAAEAPTDPTPADPAA